MQGLTLKCLPWEQDALACLVARHETLRTRFVERDGQVLQAVLPASDPHAKLPLQRLSLPGGGAPGELERLLAELTERPHQLLGAGVPARFVLVELGRDSHILHINMHHISRSAPRFLVSLCACFQNMCSGRVRVHLCKLVLLCWVPAEVGCAAHVRSLSMLQPNA